MTFAVPATIANQLLSELEHLFISGAVPSSFTLARLARDASALQKNDAANASMVKAGIAALQWDFEKTQHWVKNALLIDGSVRGLTNAALTYRQFNRFDLSCELLQQCYDRAPRDETVVTPYLQSLCATGQFAKTVGIYQLAHQQGVKVEDSQLNAAQSVRYMSEAGVSSDRLEFEMECANQVLTNNHKRTSSTKRALFADPDGSVCMVVQLCFAGDFADEMRVEAELAQRLADEPGWNPCALSVELKYIANHPHAVEHA